MRHCPAVLIGALSAIGLLAGCATPSSIEPRKAALASIRRIAILAVPEPATITFQNFGGMSGTFGAIGGAVQGLSDAGHGKEFAAMLRERKISLADNLLAAVQKAVAADGYATSVDRVDHPQPMAGGKGGDFSGIRVDSDAILYVWITVEGYVSGQSSPSYEPGVVVNARLIDARTLQDLYLKTFCVGYQWKIPAAVIVPSNARYRFNSFEELMDQSDLSIAGLVDSGAAAAVQIGDGLRAR